MGDAGQARLKIWSTSMYSGKVMSCRTSSKLGRPIKCAKFFFDPVKKLSTQTTSLPMSIRRSHRWLPRKPAPPVTRTLQSVWRFISRLQAKYGPPGWAGGRQSGDQPYGCLTAGINEAASRRATAADLVPSDAESKLVRTRRNYTMADNPIIGSAARLRYVTAASHVSSSLPLLVFY